MPFSFAAPDVGEFAAPEVAAAAVIVYEATPIVTSGQVAFGNTTGFGNGTSGTSMTTTTKGTGSGPTTPQSVVGYIEINIGGTADWVPYCT